MKPRIDIIANSQQRALQQLNSNNLKIARATIIVAAVKKLKPIGPTSE